jgi:hypothetical protein
MMYCVACAENEWQKACQEHAKLMAADRAALGDEAFVKLAVGEVWCEQAGPHCVAGPNKFYILTWNRKVTNIIGSSGYCDTREQCWSKMADKIDKYMREPYR